MNWPQVKSHVDGPEGHEVERWGIQPEIQAVGSERRQEKMLTQEKSLLLTQREQTREANGKRTHAIQGATTVDTPQGPLSPQVTLEMQRESIPSTAISPHF